MDTSLLGNIGESRVLHELVKAGVQCYLPYGDGSTVDLIADFNGKLNKIQINEFMLCVSMLIWDSYIGAYEWVFRVSLIMEFILL